MTTDGRREILGVDVVSTKDGAAWTAFLRGLVARGLHGVRLLISDAHEGLKNAIAPVLDGASWQRCRTHFMRNLLSRVPKSAQAVAATLVRSTFAQPEPPSDHRPKEAQPAVDAPRDPSVANRPCDRILGAVIATAGGWRRATARSPGGQLLLAPQTPGQSAPPASSL